METAERRIAIMKYLSRSRYATMDTLAAEFRVSRKTIQRDIGSLSLREPIYTKSGRCGGGVYVMDNYTLDRVYMNSEETKLLERVLASLRDCPCAGIGQGEISELSRLIENYRKPVKNV